jgi:hypothetical protein
MNSQLVRRQPRDFTLITRTARARASYPSCVAVYPCDSVRDVFYVGDPISSIRSEGFSALAENSFFSMRRFVALL